VTARRRRECRILGVQFDTEFDLVSVMQYRLASAGLLGLRERSVQVSGQQTKGEGEVRKLYAEGFFA